MTTTPLPRGNAEVVVACPALALDRTLLVDRVSLGELHRPIDVDVRGGGKGGNVARTLVALGTSVRLIGIVGSKSEPETDFVVADLREAGVQVIPVWGRGTRTCTTIVERSGPRVTAFYESAPACQPEVWAGFVAAAEAAVCSSATVVLTGSVPLGVTAEQMATFAESLKTLSGNLICDLAGQVLSAVLGKEPRIVTPNASEAVNALGLSDGLSDQHDPLYLAQRLVSAGAEAAVVSAGPAGAGLATDERASRRVPAPAVPVLNPTGAGDVLTAGLAQGLVKGWSPTAAAEQAVRLASHSCTTFAAADLSCPAEVLAWPR